MAKRGQKDSGGRGDDQEKRAARGSGSARSRPKASKVWKAGADQRATLDAIGGGVKDMNTPKRILLVGAVFLLLGLALVGVGPSDIGMVVTLAALLVMIFGIHTFGRLGPA